MGQSISSGRNTVGLAGGPEHGHLHVVHIERRHEAGHVLTHAEMCGMRPETCWQEATCVRTSARDLEEKASGDQLVARLVGMWNSDNNKRSVGQGQQK